MARYSLGFRTSNVTINVACVEIRSTATDALRIVEFGLFLAAATASSFGLGRPAAIGVTPTSPVTVLTEDRDPAGTAQVALAWGTAPTAPTGSAYLRRIALPATIGAGIIWQWQGGLIIPVSSSLVLYNLTATGVCDGYVVIDE